LAETNPILIVFFDQKQRYTKQIKSKPLKKLYINK
jgi:hypothetical protein